LNYTRLVLRSALPLTRFLQRAKNSDSHFSNRLNFSNLKCAPSPKRNRCVRDSNSEASQIASRGVFSSVNFQQTSPATPSAIDLQSALVDRLSTPPRTQAGYCLILPPNCQHITYCFFVARNSPDFAANP